MRWFVACIALAAMPALAQDLLPGDPQEGLEFAREHCADCHYVEQVWTGTSPFMAPAFADIAAEPRYTELALRVYLQTPHENMPDFILTEDETNKVIAYILSLKPD